MAFRDPNPRMRAIGLGLRLIFEGVNPFSKIVARVKSEQRQPEYKYGNPAWWPHGTLHGFILNLTDLILIKDSANASKMSLLRPFRG